MCTSAKDNEINTGWIWCEDSSSGLRTSRASILICAQTFCRNCWLCTCKLDVCTSALLCVLAPLTVFPAVSVRTPVGKIQDVNSHQSARLSFFFFFDMFSALIFIFPLWRSGSQELVPFGLVRFFMVSEQGQNTCRKLSRQPLLPAFTLQSANVFCFHQFNVVTLEFLAILRSKAH